MSELDAIEPTGDGPGAPADVTAVRSMPTAPLTRRASQLPIRGC
jgi:hypothetical protein